MAKLFIILLLCSVILMATPASAHGSINRINATKNWYRKHPHMKPKVTELHFYLHDIVSDPTPTNIPIAMSNFTSQSPTFFGLIAAMDDPLTVGSSPDSAIIGRAQGLFGSTALDKLGFHMTFDIVFTTGKYNGSTLSVTGHNPFMDEFRELPIVGGSGVFRLARGTALLSTVTYNVTSGDAVVEYNVVILHY